MGSGKTTVGALLALHLKLKFFDLDQYIIAQEQESIENIFLKKGEGYFRKVETHFLKTLLKSEKQYVLSTGGGTPCYLDNFSLMRCFAQTFYLKLAPELIYQRLCNEKSKRPLISNLSDKELHEFIFRHFPLRKGFYEQADHLVDVAGKSPLEIVRWIQQRCCSILFPKRKTHQ